jgi:hypothetical protein
MRSISATTNTTRRVPFVIVGILAALAAAVLLFWWLESEPTPQPRRAFDASSYWNTPMPASAPVDDRSPEWIQDSLDPAHTQPYLRLPDVDRTPGIPIYDAAEDDPLHHICTADNERCFDIHIPEEAVPANSRDSILHVWDRSTDQVIGMHKVARTSDGTFTHEGIDRWFLSSEGLDEQLPDSTAGNFGHRGVPTPVRAVRLGEVEAGAIRHRLSCFWHATAERVYWPMTQYETGKTGIVPEGVVIRIKPSVDLSDKPLTAGARVIATALQDYGCIIGDNSGSGNTLALEQGDWSELLGGADALSSIPFSEWEFVEAGYAP